MLWQGDVMINVVQNEKVYEISFQYDAVLIALVKSVPGRAWIPNAKMWTIPVENLGFLINAINGTKYESLLNLVSEEHINENATVESTDQIPDVDLSSIPFYVKEGATPFQHQYDFMKWAIARQRSGNMHGFILADEMGLAKSCESINLALYNKRTYGFNHCLIICCINSSKYNWYDEVTTHLRGIEDAYILGSRIMKRKKKITTMTGSNEKLEDIIYWKKYGDPNGEDLPYFLIMRRRT